MRVHAAAVVAGVRAVDDGGQLALIAPGPGWFRAAVAAGDVVRGGGVLGELEVLGRTLVVTAPASARGAVVALGGAAARVAVEAGGVLVVLDPRAAGEVAAGEVAAGAAAGAGGGLVFRAPTSGRFYSRSSPDKPPFVAAGSELVAGSTICLLEVMKTFHRVTYGGGELPARARVEQVLVADGDDVNLGDPLLALAPA